MLPPSPNKISWKVITMSIRVMIITAIAQIARSDDDMIGCYNCEVPPGSCTTRQWEGVLSCQQHCKDKCSDDNCYGVQYYFSSGHCYSFQETYDCKMLGYTQNGETIMYRKSTSRSDCALFYLTLTTGALPSASPIDEIDPSTRFNCVHEGLERDGCFHVVYKATWSDCYIYDACSTCTTFFSSHYDQYDFECLADCGPLTSPVNGSVNTCNGTAWDDTAVYSCESGYRLLGSETQTCSATGTWSGTSPTCEIIDCGPPAEPVSGTVSTSGGTTYGQVAVYSCNNGFLVHGTGTQICTASGTWEADVPICEPIDCGPLTDLINGTASTASGTTQDCGPLTDPVNGTVRTSDGTTLGNVAVYECALGYTLQGTETRACEPTGTWDGTAPTCEPIDCGSPPDPEHGSVNTTDGTTPGQKAVYTCDAGYQLIGAWYQSCHLTGNWTGTTPTCQPIECSTMTVVSSQLSMSLTNYNYLDSEAKFACSGGFTLAGPEEITCVWNSILEIAEWNGTQPSCQPVATSVSTTPINQPGSSPNQLSTASNQPGTSSNQLSTASNQPGTLSNQQSTASNQPGTSSNQQSTASNQPGTLSNQQSTAPNQPGTSSNQQSTASNQPGTSSNQQSTASNQPGTSSNQLSTASQQGTTSTNQQSSATNQPAPTTTASHSKPIYIWPCLCSTNAFAGLTEDEIIEQLVNDIKIDTDQTANAIRKKTSHEDHRVSAVSIGTVGMVLLIGCGGVLIILDLAKMKRCKHCNPFR